MYFLSFAVSVRLVLEIRMYVLCIMLLVIYLRFLLLAFITLFFI